MIFQELDFSCGPASIVNALRCLGYKKTEKSILKISNTNSQNGTSEEDMVRVLMSLGFEVKRHEQGNFEKAWKWLCKQLKNGNPVIISVKNWQHYVAVIGVIGEKIIITDSGDRNENGILVLDKLKLKRFWHNRIEKLYTGMAIRKS